MAVPQERERISADSRELLESLGLLTAENMEVLSQAQTVNGLWRD